MTKYDYREAEVPAHQARRSGCKVHWRYYDSREDAEQAAKIADHQADIQWGLGYDFGYCSPGTIVWTEPGSQHGGENGRWQVCFP